MRRLWKTVLVMKMVFSMGLGRVIRAQGRRLNPCENEESIAPAVERNGHPSFAILLTAIWKNWPKNERM